jgi:chromosome segregation protein
VDTDIETMQERVWTEYGLTYDSALEYKDPDFDAKIGASSINKVKKDIVALGHINERAIEDCKALEDRFGKMYTQSQDLIKAEGDLKRIIKDLSNEMIVRFQTEFDKINTNFGIVFKELFGGGSARLEIMDSEDQLEAGIEIKAEPPEKKLSNISLLSGGEQALVAIAILFAILRLRPLPFCLLDEIEAPLDEANVTRLAKYLKRYSHETQFIVITHKKPTMENADTLFGVTMEEKGVSKLVSVKLSDAIKNTEQK